MESSVTVQDYDLMLITDATCSVRRFLQDLKIALPQIFDLVKLTNLIERVSVLAFRINSDKCINVDWSGWSNVQDTDHLTEFVGKLFGICGVNIIEAVRTGLCEASKLVERPTICLMYVDGAPHHDYVKTLREETSQWPNVCELLREQKMCVYPILSDLHDHFAYPFYISLAEITNGQCIQINSSGVVRTTIGILLNLAGIEFEYDNQSSNVKMARGEDFKELLGKDSKNYARPPEKLPVKIEAIEDIRMKIGNPVKCFNTSEEYRNLVFTVFERLLMPDRVIAFTYNTIFGKLWREICKQRKDPRRNLLVEKLSASVSTVSASDRATLQTFLDESYDQKAEIESILVPFGTEGPFYVIDNEEPLTRKVLFEIGLSCAPFAVQSVLKLLTGLRITNQLPSQESNLMYIQVNLPTKLKFKLLPHLICPGTMFTLRLSAIMATIAKVSGSILRDDATDFLSTIRGKWIDLTLPECNSIDFARLMIQAEEEALTLEEVKHFRALITVGSLKRSKNIQLEIEAAYSSYKSKRPDFKNQCETCKQWRSVTLLLDKTCALCLVGNADKCIETSTEVESWMCECWKCLVHYAVCRIDNLKCKAKCHFCRVGEIAPFVECLMCKNKFLYQQSQPMPNYVCAVCTENNGRVGEKFTLTVAEYIAKNGAGFIGMKVDADIFFDDRIKLSKMSAEEKLEAVRNFADIAETDLTGHTIAFGEISKQVWNVKELQQHVLKALAIVKVSKCMICFEDIPDDKLSLICGSIKNGCTVVACRKCLNCWYNQLAPGRICQPAQLVCPYCKRVPKVKIVRQYNRRLCTLMNTTDVGAFNPSYIHAWCVKCYAVKEAMTRECGSEYQDIIDFKCTDCSASCNADFKECPKCKVVTEKHGGCNHIACENLLIDGNKCDAHWCWLCGALSTYSEIYIHLSKAHGGYFSAEDIENIDEDYMDEE